MVLREERSKEREPASKKVEPEKIINTPFLNRASLSELTALHRTGQVALGIDELLGVSRPIPQSPLWGF